MTDPDRAAAVPRQDPFAPFRPRRGRAVSASFAVGTTVLFLFVAAGLPGPGEGGNWRLGDRIFFVAVGLGIAALLWRYATIRALPTRESLTVRNLFTTRTVAWASIVDLRFGGGDPWVTLELDDTDTLAVMAVQKADGAFGRAEASRLAALVQALGPSAPGPDTPAVDLGD